MFTFFQLSLPPYLEDTAAARRSRAESIEFIFGVFGWVWTGSEEGRRGLRDWSWQGSRYRGRWKEAGVWGFPGRGGRFRYFHSSSQAGQPEKMCQFSTLGKQDWEATEAWSREPVTGSQVHVSAFRLGQVVTTEAWLPRQTKYTVWSLILDCLVVFQKQSFKCPTICPMFLFDLLIPLALLRDAPKKMQL